MQVRAGVYDSGSRRGLSLLATLRDGAGQGPSTPWSLKVLGPSGTEVAAPTYDDSSPGSFSAWWWETLAPQLGRYRVQARGPEGAAIELPFEVPDWAGLDAPSPTLSTDGASLVWTAVSGAASYSCRFYSSGILEGLSSPDASPSCATRGLPDGSYSTAVLAFQTDLRALAAESGPSPALPAAFSISEGRVGFAKGGAASGKKLSAAGGALNFGPSAGGLALWVSLAEPGGGAPTAEWQLSIVGPGLSPSAPWLATYPPGARQRVFWSYELQPRAGTYTATATSAGQSLVTSFSVGEPKWLEIPRGVSVSPGTSGAADVAWSPVAGAASYFVSVWPKAAGATSPAASAWTVDSSARFAPGTFAAGERYDVYVAAADVDITASLPPPALGAVAVSENSYTPVSFTAP
ncbi:MAG: hypothetical protein HYZ28_18765 [Myxococcales bacterium]|nr:hypothetical protein [Myxococcales bacterium]